MPGSRCDIHFLNSPRSSEPRSVYDIHEESCEFLSHVLRGNKIESFICNFDHISKGQIAPWVRFSNPKNYTAGRPVYSIHYAHLTTPLIHIVLVYANSINPKKPHLDFISNMPKRNLEIFGDLPIVTIYDDFSFGILISLSV